MQIFGGWDTHPILSMSRLQTLACIPCVLTQIFSVHSGADPTLRNLPGHDSQLGSAFQSKATML